MITIYLVMRSLNEDGTGASTCVLSVHKTIEGARLAMMDDTERYSYYISKYKLLP